MQNLHQPLKLVNSVITAKINRKLTCRKATIASVANAESSLLVGKVNC